MGRNLKMPWSMDDTVKNMDHIRDMMIKRVRQVNLDGKGEEDVKEINFDFGRVREALKKQIPMEVDITIGGRLYGGCPICGRLWQDKIHIYNYCECCGQKLKLPEGQLN